MEKVFSLTMSDWNLDYLEIESAEAVLFLA